MHIKIICEEKKTKNMDDIQEHVSCETNLISLKFSMSGHVYVGNKICNFGKNQLSSFRDMRG